MYTNFTMMTDSALSAIEIDIKEEPLDEVIEGQLHAEGKGIRFLRRHKEEELAKREAQVQ